MTVGKIPPQKQPELPYSYDEMVRKIVMWRNALETGYDINVVFDSICVYLGEQQREIELLRKYK